MRARQAKGDAVVGEEEPECLTVKFAAVVRLKSKEGETKLSSSISEERA
jgi:hypothetical protein